VTTRRRLLAAAIAAPAAATALAAPAAADDSLGDHAAQGRLRWPVRTTQADWAGVAAALGRPGGLLDGGRVYRTGFPRRDLTVTSHGVVVRPSLSLGSYAALSRYRDGRALLMGDLVVTEAELGPVTDALHAAGLAQTAIHKHLLAHEPQLWWTHLHGLGHPVWLAAGVRAALDRTATPPAGPPNPAPGDLDGPALDAVLGRTGGWDGGVYKYTVPRAGTISDDGRVLAPGMGVTTVLGFQPAAGGTAVVNGDFAMTGMEVQCVIAALRAGGIAVVSLHNHALHDTPRLFYCHFWAAAPATALR